MARKQLHITPSAEGPVPLFAQVCEVITNNMSNKFPIFLSHVAQDSTIAVHLKDALVRAYAGAVTIFVSSDDQSIPGGSAWFTQISDNLKNARLVLTLVTRNSLAAPWIYFESGGAHLRGIPVAPLLLRDLDFKDLPPPLSLLQGRCLTRGDDVKRLLTDIDRHSGLSGQNFDVDRFIHGLDVLLALKDDGTSLPEESDPSISAEEDADQRAEALYREMSRTREFFDLRFGQTFPGNRGTAIYRGQSAVLRLERLLTAPIVVESRVGTSHPIWWWRGTSNMHIDCFSLLAESAVVIDVNEYDVDYIAAVAVGHRSQFVYVHTKATPQTGLRPQDETRIAARRKTFGYVKEEYALYKGRMVTREEYDDGAAEIDGRPVVFEENPSLRVRYLTPYNFIIAPQDSPINDSKHDLLFEEVLNGILWGTRTLEDLITLVTRLPPRRHRRGI